MSPSITPPLEDPIPGYRFLVSLDPTDAYLPFAQSLIITFLKDGVGFTNTEIGATNKTLAFIGSAAGGVTAGVLGARYGLRRMLVGFGLLAALTNVFYVWLSITGYGRDHASRHRVAFGDDGAVAGGLHPDIESAIAATRPDTAHTYRPDPAAHSRYNQLYAQFRDLYELLGRSHVELLHELKRIRTSERKGG